MLTVGLVTASVDMKNSLKDRLYRYLVAGHGWISSGSLQRIVADKTDYTPRTVVRRLEELAEEGKLEVQYRKGHAFYKARQLETMAEWFDALPEMPMRSML